MADDELEFHAGALGVVQSWLLGGDEQQEEEEQAVQTAASRAPVALYRPSSATDKPSLTGRNAGAIDTTTEEQRELKRKILKRPGAAYKSPAERAAEAAKQADKEQEEALDREEMELERLRGKGAEETKDGEQRGKKRKLTAQEELLEKLREEAARKKAKNLKQKLRQQRKKQKQLEQQQQPS